MSTSVKPYPARLFGDDAVFQRTLAGQRKLLWASGELPEETKRFLAMVNGHTDVRTLLSLGFPAAAARQAVKVLMQEELIEIVLREERRWAA